MEPTPSTRELGPGVATSTPNPKQISLAGLSKEFSKRQNQDQKGKPGARHFRTLAFPGPFPSSLKENGGRSRESLMMCGDEFPETLHPVAGV